MLIMTIELPERVPWHKPFYLHPSSISVFIFTQVNSLDLVKAFAQYLSVRIEKDLLDTYNLIRAKLYFFH